ncbi:hypothetical protein ACIQW5_10465 [Methylorubrum thiocyanatum]|uniref:hypothetical protein n=1 Tax=Methylorubrum thiocyanatum TaxID=47958 RepID=UPI00383A28D5
MKIVDRETFLSLPPGTVYAEFNGELEFESLNIMYGGQDFGDHSFWSSQELGPWSCETITADDGMPFLAVQAMAKGEGRGFDQNCAGRDEDYHESPRKFCVFDNDDVRKLRDLLTEALVLTGGEA